MTCRRAAAVATLVAVSLLSSCSAEDAGNRATSTAPRPDRVALPTALLEDPLVGLTLERAAATLESSAFKSLVANLDDDDDAGLVDEDSLDLLSVVNDGRSGLAAGLRQIAAGKNPGDDVAEFAATALATPWFVAAENAVPTDPSDVTSGIRDAVATLREPDHPAPVELDPDIYRLMKMVGIDTNSSEFSRLLDTLEGELDRTITAESVSASRGALAPLFAGSSSAETSNGDDPTTTPKPASLRNLRSARLQPDSTACRIAQKAVRDDVVAYVGALAALAGLAIVTDGTVLVIGLSAVGTLTGLYKAMNDLERDSATVSDPNGPCGLGDNRGDPHVLTFDGLNYDPQAVGEFVLMTTGPGGETIQVRHQPITRSRYVSTVTGVAADVEGEPVSIVSAGRDVVVTVGGVATRPDADGVALAGGGRLVAVEPDDLRLVWPSGTILRVRVQNGRLAVTVAPADSLAGRSAGLLGNADGDPGNDLTTRTGRLITSIKEREQLYGQFMESWRITQQESLFAYEPGESTETMTDRTFPDRVRTVADLTAEQRSLAEDACKRAGIEDPVMLDECMFDVGFSGDESFAFGLADQLGILRAEPTSKVLTTGESSGSIAAPGDSVEYRFEADAGEARYFRTELDCDDNRVGWRVVDASGTSISREPYVCADIGRVEFREAGTYRVIVWSYLGSTGEYSFTWEKSSDEVGRLGSGRTTGKISAAGEVDLYSFDVKAGEIRFFAHDEPCTATKLGWRLLDGTGKQIGPFPFVCADLGRFEFPKAGSYQLAVESYEGSTGTYAFSWNGVEDRTSPLGAGRTSGAIDAKGQINTYTVRAKAGERRTFAADGGCKDSKLGWRVLDASGKQVTSFPYICSDIGAVTFPAAGEYRLTVESYQGSVGDYAFTTG